MTPGENGLRWHFKFENFSLFFCSFYFLKLIAHNAEIAARNVEIALCNEAACAETERKKKLLGEIFSTIDGFTDDEAIFMLQVLAKDED